MLRSVMRLIFKTSSVTPDFFYVFSMILSFSTCSQSFKKIYMWKILGANVLKWWLLDVKSGTRGIFSSALLPDYSLSLLTGVGIEGTVHGRFNLQGSHNKSWTNKHNDAKDGKRNAAGLRRICERSGTRFSKDPVS